MFILPMSLPPCIFWCECIPQHAAWWRQWRWPNTVSVLWSLACPSFQLLQQSILSKTNNHDILSSQVPMAAKASIVLTSDLSLHLLSSCVFFNWVMAGGNYWCTYRRDPYLLFVCSMPSSNVREQKHKLPSFSTSHHITVGIVLFYFFFCFEIVCCKIGFNPNAPSTPSKA